MNEHGDKNVETKYGLNLESEWSSSLGVGEETGASPSPKLKRIHAQ